jgi:hypothetical protein
MAITGETSVADAIERETQKRIQDLAAALVAKVEKAAVDQLLADQKAALIAEEQEEEEEEDEEEGEEEVQIIIGEWKVHSVWMQLKPKTEDELGCSPNE